MLPPSQVSLGQPVPDRDHAVSVHIPQWNQVCDFALGKGHVHNALQNGYPRTFLHKDVRALFDKCSTEGLTPSQGLALFPDYKAAEDCKLFMTSSRMHKDSAADPQHVSIFVVNFDKEELSLCIEKTTVPPRLYAVVHPKEAESLKMSFWRLTGRGISSRRAAQYLNRKCRFTAITSKPEDWPVVSEPPVYGRLRERIASLLERAPINPLRVERVSQDDVYFYPSGMAAIYHVHQSLLKWRYADIIMLGFPYELSIKMMEIMGPPYRFFSSGTDSEIDELEEVLRVKTEKGQKIQAVWCECPNNPLLRTVDMDRVRKLADEHDFLLVVDDTIGSFANVDVQDVADIVVSSLTKNFNGFADVLAGSVVFNPKFPHHSELKSEFNASYENNLYVGDAEQLEHNNRDYLKNFAQQNDTAAYLADYLHSLTLDSKSSLKCVFYPKFCWSKKNYLARMRPKTSDFVPGLGGVLTVSFKSVNAAAAFFDNLEVYKGPSFGANVAISIPYVQLVFQKEKDWASSNGLDETLVRISVGLEDKEALLGCIKTALQAADATFYK